MMCRGSTGKITVFLIPTILILISMVAIEIFNRGRECSSLGHNPYPVFMSGPCRGQNITEQVVAIDDITDQNVVT